MDPDMEFNALSALYQSVIQDMKSSYPAWEIVAQKAQKLSAQLKVTVACISGFVDSVQAVSDYANNLKGASRDVGACVTRVCMRERAVENRLRAMADSLSDELVISIQQRIGYWRQRTMELDKQAAKHVKKVRSRKTRPDQGSVNEQRQLCQQILGEQRTQFSFFVSTLMPVLNAEISVLDEGPHIRQVVDSLDSTVKHVDNHTLVQTILSDVSQGADNAWRQCLTIAGRMFRASEDSVSTRVTTPEDNDITPQGIRPHTISGSKYIAHPALSAQTFLPLTKPPLQRKPSDKSISKSSFTPPPDMVPPSSYRGSHFDLTTAPNGRVQRPQSFTGELRTNFAQSPSFYPNPVYPVASSSCSSSDATSSAALIAETLQQIDQLGSELENYCTVADQRQHVHTEYAQPRQMNGGGMSGLNDQVGVPVSLQNGVRIRSESSSRPPPPTRRSSTITAATPTAPSIAEARMSMGAIMGSRQSLNSSSTYNGPLGSNSDLRYSNVNPYARPASNYKI